MPIIYTTAAQPGEGGSKWNAYSDLSFIGIFKTEVNITRKCGNLDGLTMNIINNPEWLDQSAYKFSIITTIYQAPFQTWTPLYKNLENIGTLNI